MEKVFKIVMRIYIELMIFSALGIIVSLAIASNSSLGTILSFLGIMISAVIATWIWVKIKLKATEEVVISDTELALN